MYSHNCFDFTQVVVLFLGAPFFSSFYLPGEARAWGGLMRDSLHTLNLDVWSLTSLGDLLSVRFVFRGIGWPTGLRLSSQLILAISVYVFSTEFALLAWKHAYYKYLRDPIITTDNRKQTKIRGRTVRFT